MQWNFSLQRELAPNLSATVAYAGSHGLHQPFRADNMNTVPPLQTSAPPIVWPTPGLGTCPANPAYCVFSPLVGRTDGLAWINNSSFHALEAQIEKRMSHGFQVQGSYTWSRAIDQGAGTGTSDQYLSAISSPFYLLPKYRRAAADFNIPQNLTINYIWQIPTPSSLSGPAVVAARGWQLGGILQIRNGLPFTPLMGGDPLGAFSSWRLPIRTASGARDAGRWSILAT